jgi:hypothetical protein
MSEEPKPDDLKANDPKPEELWQRRRLSFIPTNEQIKRAVSDRNYADHPSGGRQVGLLKPS